MSLKFKDGIVGTLLYCDDKCNKLSFLIKSCFLKDGYVYHTYDNDFNKKYLLTSNQKFVHIENIDELITKIEKMIEENNKKLKIDSDEEVKDFFDSLLEDNEEKDIVKSEQKTKRKTNCIWDRNKNNIQH